MRRFLAALFSRPTREADLNHCSLDIVGGSKGAGVVINGKLYQGNNIRIEGNRVFVDGRPQEGALIGTVSVAVQGDVESVSTSSGDIEIQGNAGSVSAVSGSIKIGGDVGGDVSSTSGSVSARVINGNVETVSGSIKGALK